MNVFQDVRQYQLPKTIKVQYSVYIQFNFTVIIEKGPFFTIFGFYYCSLFCHPKNVICPFEDVENICCEIIYFSSK